MAAASLVAVDGVSLELAAGETLALVGESGSGKSTVARCIVRLIEPSGGDVVIDGNSILPLQPSRLAGVYRRIQMVFQDPNASLNPRMSVRQVLDEPLHAASRPAAQRSATARVRELVEMVGLTGLHLDRYPHELSGGQRQTGRHRPGDRGLAGDRHPRRADLLARRLGARPDPRPAARAAAAAEPRLSLHQPRPAGRPARRRPRRGDVPGRHRRDRADRSASSAPRKHPYTRALLSAAPVAQWGVTRTRLRLVGEITSPIDPPDACRLVGRCPLARPACSAAKPAADRYRPRPCRRLSRRHRRRGTPSIGDLQPPVAAAATRGLDMSIERRFFARLVVRLAAAALVFATCFGSGRAGKAAGPRHSGRHRQPRSRRHPRPAGPGDRRQRLRAAGPDQVQRAAGRDADGRSGRGRAAARGVVDGRRAGHHLQAAAGREVLSRPAIR